MNTSVMNTTTCQLTCQNHRSQLWITTWLELAQLLSNEAWHSTLDPMVSCQIVRRLNHLLVTNSNRLVRKFRVILDFDSRKKHVHINMYPSPRQYPLLPHTVYQVAHLLLHSIPFVWDTLHVSNFPLILAHLILTLLHFLLFFRRIF